jgi:phosphoadenosine phosphosulfate reductase
MRITMVKKRLASGEFCAKCLEAERLLQERNVYGRLDEIVIADERDPRSPGMMLAARHQIDLAPFFVVDEEDGSPPTVFTSTLRLIRQKLGPTPMRTTGGSLAVLDNTAISRLSAGFEDKHPKRVIDWACETFGDTVAIAFSGAEDVVLLHMAFLAGRDVTAFVLDTGRLHPETLEYIETVRKAFDLRLEVMTPRPADLEPFVQENGLFSFYRDGHHGCCGIRKVAPLKRQLATRRAWITGQRRDQSPTRADVQLLAFDEAFEGADGVRLVKVNPLALWSSAEVWDWITTHDLPYNPLHDKGFKSIGCAPCTRATNPGEHERAGRWWWEEATKRECGLHLTKTKTETDPGAPSR